MTMQAGVLGGNDQDTSWDQIIYAPNPDAYAPIEFNSSAEAFPVSEPIDYGYTEPATDVYSYAQAAPDIPGLEPYGPPAQVSDVAPQEYAAYQQSQPMYDTPDFGYQSASLPEIQSPVFTPQLTPYNASLDLQPYDPSLGAQFGFGATGEGGLTDAQAAAAMFGERSDPFFANPQFAESNAQFDYTTDPANRDGVGLLGGLGNVAGAGLQAGTDAINTVGDVRIPAPPQSSELDWLRNQLGIDDPNASPVTTIGGLYAKADEPSDWAQREAINVLGDNAYGRTVGAGLNTLLDPMTLLGAAIGGTGAVANIVGRGELGLLPYAASSFGAGAGAQGAAELGASPELQMLAGLAGGVGGALAPGLIADAARGLPRGSYGAILGPTGSEDDAARQAMRDLDAVARADAADPRRIVIEVVHDPYPGALVSGRDIPAIWPGTSEYQGRSLIPVKLTAGEEAKIASAESGKAADAVRHAAQRRAERDFVKWYQSVTGAAPGYSVTPSFVGTSDGLTLAEMPWKNVEIVKPQPVLPERMTPRVTPNPRVTRRVPEVPVPATQAIPETPASLPDVVNKLRTSIDDARPLSATTKELQSAERSRRVAISESIIQRGGYTTEAYDAARAAQGGPLPRVAFDAVSPNFTPAEVQGLRQNVIDVFRADAKTAGHSLYYTEANALDALGKVMAGQLDELRPSDIGLLDHVFGREVTTSIVAKLSREAGIRGGVHWPIAGLDFSDESKSIIQQFIDNAVGTDTMPLKSVDDLKSALRVDLGMDSATRTPGIVENIKDRPWRGITSKIGGDLADPIATEMVNQEDQLYRSILKAEVKKIARVNLDGLSEADKLWAKADEFLQAQEAMNKAREATRLYRNEVFNSIDDVARKRELFQALAASDVSKDAAHNALLKKLADVQQPLKEIMLSADFGVALQQGARGVRMGGTSALTSAVAKVADNVMGAIGKDVDSFGIYPNAAISHRAAAEADGLILRGSASVGIDRDFASAASDRLLGQKLNLKLPVTLARKGLEKLSDVQYGLLDKFRLQVYEGRLIQEKLLGNNIADPRVRRAIADFANTAGSTARTATNQTRRQAERGLLLSPQLTRAQFAEIAQPLKTFTSRTQATNTLNYVASMAATFGLAYAVQSQFGPEMSLDEFLSRSADPTKTTFGRLLIGAKGEAKVTDFLPQFSLERAVIKSIAAASDGDLKKIGDTWVKFGTGRLNVLPSAALNITGTGYGKDGEFFYGNMPLDQRALGAAPIPLGVENAVIEGQNDATSIVLNTLGGNVYPESPTAERARTDPQLQGAIDIYWGAYDQALSIVKSENLASGPYAPLLAKAQDYDQLRYMIDMVVAEAQKEDPFINKNSATQAILKELGITQTAQEVRKAAVRRNPAVIQYLIERGDDIPKYLQDVYKETQVGQ